MVNIMENIAQNIRQLKEDFSSIGARVQIVPYSKESGMFKCNIVKVNVVEDERGEFFELTISRDILNNLRVVRKDQYTNHLILVASENEQYLCGSFNKNLFIKNIFRKNNSLFGKKKSSFDGSHRKRLSGSYLSMDKISELYKHSAGGKRQYIH